MTAAFYPPLIQWRRDACNGMYPSSKLLGAAVAAENHLTAHRHKEVFSCDWRLDSSAHSFTPGPTTLRRFRFRTGHGATRLRALVLLGKCANGGAPPVNPTTKINVTLSGGATTVLGPWSYGVAAAIDDAPSLWNTVIAEIVVAPNSIYECEIVTTDFARPLGVTVYEVGNYNLSEATDFYNQRSPQAGSTILDDDRARLLIGADQLLRHNGATAFHWGRRDGTTRTRTSATPINLVDGSSTAISTATPGFSVNMTYHRTASRTTVPVELAVYGRVSASTGIVRIVNSVGTPMATCSVSATANAWTVVTGSLPASTGKYDVQFYGDGANTLTVYALSLIEWES